VLKWRSPGEADLDMSIDTVRAYFKNLGIENRILEFEESSATVEQAALALNVSPARISKTLSFKTDKGCMLIVCAGDARIDNRKFKDLFGFKAKMLSPEEVNDLVGHPVGGVCPFGIKPGVPVYLDESMLRFETVFPAAGSGNSAIELTIDELFKYSKARGWVDVCSVPEESAAV
jgi:prolyl-tRNA editing enzyme YbaK/EbsC (Cys-tRNA(Pro) deacylase)